MAENIKIFLNNKRIKFAVKAILYYKNTHRIAVFSNPMRILIVINIMSFLVYFFLLQCFCHIKCISFYKLTQ